MGQPLTRPPGQQCKIFQVWTAKKPFCPALHAAPGSLPENPALHAAPGGLPGNPALRPNPWSPRRGRGVGAGQPRALTFRGTAVKSSKWTAKTSLLPGSPRGPGEPWAPTGVPGQKPAAPGTRLSIRTRGPTLKHPPPESLPRAPRACPPPPLGLLPLLRPHIFSVFRGFLRGLHGARRSARLSGMAMSSPRSGLPSPTRVAALNRLPTAPLNPLFLQPWTAKNAHACLAGLPVLNQSAQS